MQEGGQISGRGFKAEGLNCFSQAKLIVGAVKDGEVLANEDITQDPELSRGGVEVHAFEATGAGAILLQVREQHRRPERVRVTGCGYQAYWALWTVCKASARSGFLFQGCDCC